MQFNAQIGEDSEQAVVASMIMKPDLVPFAVQRLEAEDFGNLRNRELFRLVLELDREYPGTADAVVVGQAIEERGLERKCGSKDQLFDYLGGFPPIAYLEPHVERVKEASKSRRYATIFDIHAQKFANGDLTGEQAVISISNEHLKLLGKFGNSGPRRVGEINQELRGKIEKLASVDKPPDVVSTPFSRLNAVMPSNGFEAGHLVVIAAGTGMGKSAFAQQVAEHIAETENVLFFALEMSSHEVIKRFYTRKVEVFGRRMGFAYGKSVDIILEKTEVASNDLHRLNLYLYDEPNLCMDMIRAHTLSTHRRVGVRAIFIDYLQLLQPHQKDSRQPRTVQVGGMTRAAKLLAKEIGCPVFLVAQLGFTPENRKSPKVTFGADRKNQSCQRNVLPTPRSLPFSAKRRVS